MGKSDDLTKGVIELSPERDGRTVIDLISSSPEKGTPVRAIFCVKKNVNMREIEKREDCFILDFDPSDTLDLPNLFKGFDNPNLPDISVIAEKGQVACRDYPHSRHNCLKNPFEKTPHESCCELCHCFVCDVVAPCKKWTGHCHAIDNESWRYYRRATRKLMNRDKGIEEPEESDETSDEYY